MSTSDEYNRQSHDKASPMNAEKSDTRHHEVTIELRKTKKEKLRSKRHSLRADDPMSKSQGATGQAQQQVIVEEIVVAMNSEDSEDKFMGIQQARKMLSCERNPPIDLMIENGIVPICIQFLQDSTNTLLQFEAAWALTNIVSGTSEQTRCVIDQNAVPHFKSLLQAKSPYLAEQAVWALGNIAGDGPAARDIVIQHNVIDDILDLVSRETPISFLRNIVWLMSNLCRNNYPPPPFEEVKRLLPVLSQLLIHRDMQVLSDACWALSYVTDNDNNKIQAVVDTDAVPRLVNLLQSEELGVVVPALRSVGNIVAGTNEQTDLVIAAGGLPKLGVLLKHTKATLVKEAAWTVSNVTAGSQMQIQAVMDAEIFHQIRHVLEKGDIRAQKEAAWAVTNATAFGSVDQIMSLIEKYKILKPFINLLDSKDHRTVYVVATGLSNLLAFADKVGSTENLCLMIEEMGGLEKLQPLQQHEVEDVCKKAFAIIEKYFTPRGDQPEQ